jgi:hypothetical protein
LGAQKWGRFQSDINFRPCTQPSSAIPTTYEKLFFGASNTFSVSILTVVPKGLTAGSKGHVGLKASKPQHHHRPQSPVTHSTINIYHIHSFSRAKSQNIPLQTPPTRTHAPQIQHFENSGLKTKNFENSKFGCPEIGALSVRHQLWTLHSTHLSTTNKI